MTTQTAVEPSIWVGCLACYNAGHLIGEWVTLELGDREANETAVKEYTDTHTSDTAYPHEEWMAFDHEGIPGLKGESINEAFDILEALHGWVETYGDQIPIDVFGELHSQEFEPSEVSYFGEADSYKDVASQMVDDGLYGEIPEQLVGYIDCDAIGRDLRLNGLMEIGGHFWSPH